MLWSSTQARTHLYSYDGIIINGMFLGYAFGMIMGIYSFVYGRGRMIWFLYFDGIRWYLVQISVSFWLLVRIKNVF